MTVRGACPHDCPDTCALQIAVEDGRVVKVQGDADHPTTHGALCTKVSRYAERVYHPERVLHPLKRVGPKGEGRFVRVSWDEALDFTASKMQAIIDEYGPNAVMTTGSSRGGGNEANYVMQKFTRACIGTHSVDNCART